MRIKSQFAKLLSQGFKKVFIEYYNNISLLYTGIFTGMTKKDKKAKKWIEKFMKRYE